MITTLAEVVANEHGYVIARCQRHSSCGSCASKGDCGVSVVAKAMPNKAFTIKVPTEDPIEAGTLIEIGIQEEVLIKSAALLYLLPLFFAIGCALIVHFITENEAVVILSCFLSGCFGFAFAKRKASQLEKNVETKPQLLRIVSCTKTDPA